MKFTFAFFALLAVSGFLTAHSVPVSTNKSVRDHLKDFLDLLPLDELENLVFEYLAEDEDFAETLDYLLSDEFRTQVVEIEGAAEFKACLNFLEKLGVPAYEYVNKLNEQLHLDPISIILRARSSRITGGLPGFLKDVKALLPVDNIKKLYNEKIANAPEFAKFDKSLKSQESYDLFGKLFSNPHIKGLFEKAKAKGVDIQAILDFISSIFEFEFPSYFAPVSFVSKSLVHHLEDFLTVLPIHQFKELFYEYMSDDEDFAIVLDYLMGDEFKYKLQSIESTSEFKDTVNFFEKFGLPAYEVINELNALLGIDSISPLLRRTMSSRITGGLPGFLKDFKDLLSVNDIKKLYDEKMADAPEFSEFVHALLSEKFFGLVDKVVENKDVQDLIGKAESKGVDFKAILDFISSLFGISIPHPEVFVSKSLNEDLEDFLKLIPVKKIEELVFEYLAEDEDFAAALDFILGDEFKAKLTNIESSLAFKEYLNYLEESGLPAYEYVNKLNAQLGIDLIKPLHRLMASRITGGLPGFLQDIKDLLPVDEIKKLYKEKLETSEQFAKLIQRLQSEEKYNLLVQLLNISAIKELLGLVQSKGVNIQAIIDFISSIFDIKFPPIP